MSNISSNTKALGIHQSDIIIRTAIIAGIRDLRANPYLLDYVFANLAQDNLTSGSYGQREIDQAKKWFLSTNIPVFMNYRVDEAKCPAISITLLESVESENTLADVNYDTREDTDTSWPAITSVFNPTSYDSSTGTVIVPDSVSKEIILTAGQVLVNKSGETFTITEVFDNTSFTIDTTEVTDLAGSVIKGQKPSLTTDLEAAFFKETYSVGCHAHGEGNYLSYLHSIVAFILLRYRQSLLEARGFERTSIGSSDFRKNEAFGIENVFSRWISITGFVRNYWPKDTKQKIAGVGSIVTVQDSGNVPEEVDLETATWIGDLDPLTAGFLK